MYQSVHVCTGKAFQGIVNPYTDLPVETRMLVRDGKPALFYAPGTYSPVSPHDSSEKAPRVCLWTGKVLALQTDDQGKVWSMGGFNPHVPVPRERYLYMMRMRNGISELPPPSDVRVTPVQEQVPMPKSHEVRMLEGSEEAAESILKKSGFKTQKNTTVQVTRKVSRR